MTATPFSPPPIHSWLDFNSPLSSARSAGLVDRLAGSTPSTVLDLGCGWGELMLRLLSAVPGAVGTGVDTNAEHLARGRANAASRGLADRAEFIEGPVAGFSGGPGDVVLCVGSSHAFGDAEPPAHTAEALNALRNMVGTGGRVLFGESFWQRPPTADELAKMWPGASADEHVDLTALVELAGAARFRPMWIETANLDEWEQFESGYLAGKEEWLASHRDHPESAAVRAAADEHRKMWLGYRGILGFAYLTLIAY
ncbi:methyltransferase domain-containing protein [Embleya sp. NBC_00896]|uniref:SAM-dependent methyltransferase n=1 Tax=Embleya sp. NBC_00896 TaxID=2975961 RepID=UPI002F90F3CC|nr:methyltransferase domain-containing protein [Embleya sp. NBC_00896]